MNEQNCRFCGNATTTVDYFCPNCGKKLKDKTLSTGIGKQILVYVISFFLPPFGLPYAFKYFKQDNDKARVIGYVVIGLTVLSIIINIWLIVGFVNQTTNEVNNAFKGVNYGY